MRALFFSLRLVLLSFLLMLAACGAEQAQVVLTVAASTAVPVPTANTPPEATIAPTSAPVANISRGKGDPNAPVKVIEYSDFQ